ncbi:MAG TPA: hypothetical protein VK680_02400 [Solirubrobacteraceae bacterium]|nr:hypothetical protein [Solirubrobacteraceae bacterium]
MAVHVNGFTAGWDLCDNRAVQALGIALDTVLVYDDEPDQRRTRRHSAQLACERLLTEGVLAHQPSIRATGLRHDALQILSEGGRTLLLADLIGYDEAPRGARLMRAVSARPDVTVRTWRIALTRRADPRIAERLSGHTNAVVVYDDTDLNTLVESIGVVLAGEPLSTGGLPPTFPDGAAERYVEALNQSLREAMHGEFSAADAEAMFRWIHDTQDRVTAETDPDELPAFYREHERGPAVAKLERLLDGVNEQDQLASGCTKPSEVRALQQKLKRRSPSLEPRQLRARGKNKLWPVTPSGLSDTVSPQAVMFVTERENQSRAREWTESKDSTWLTEAEHIVAWALIDAAEKELDKLAKSLPDRRKKVTGGDACIALNNLFKERLPGQCAAVGLNVWDAHYAVCTIVDWLVDLDDAPFTTIGGRGTSHLDQPV